MCVIGLIRISVNQDKDKSSDTESHSSAPSQDSILCRPTAEELVLGFQLHRMQQHRKSQYSDGFNALNCEPRLNIQDFLEKRASNNVIQVRFILVVTGYLL